MCARRVEIEKHGSSDTKVNILLDSGAHSLYTLHVLKGSSSGKKFYKAPEFRSFFEEYMAWLQKYKGTLNAYVGLDIIKNPKATYEVISEMWANGLDPIPVIHGGTDISWLKKYLDKTGYIGVGGLGQRTKARTYYKFADTIFGYICNKKTGRPSVKTHGFAMTTPYYLSRYPWYSVDSTTWAKMAGYGQILVPTPSSDGWNYFNGRNIGVTERVLGATRDWNILAMPEAMRDVMNRYCIEQCGLSLNMLSEQHEYRRAANLRFYVNMGIQLKKLYAEKFAFPEGGNVYFASPDQVVDSYKDVSVYFKDEGIIRLLPSYYYQSELRKVRKFQRRFDDSLKVKKAALRQVREKLVHA